MCDERKIPKLPGQRGETLKVPDKLKQIQHFFSGFHSKFVNPDDVFCTNTMCMNHRMIVKFGKSTSAWSGC